MADIFIHIFCKNLLQSIVGSEAAIIWGFFFIHPSVLCPQATIPEAFLEAPSPRLE